MSSAATIAPAASVMEAAPVAQAFARTAAAWSRLEATLAQLPPPPSPTGYVPRQWHTMTEPLADPLDHPATDPDRWAQFL